MNWNNDNWLFPMTQQSGLSSAGLGNSAWCGWNIQDGFFTWLGAAQTSFLSMWPFSQIGNWISLNEAQHCKRGCPRNISPNCMLLSSLGHAFWHPLAKSSQKPRSLGGTTQGGECQGSSEPRKLAHHRYMRIIKCIYSGMHIAIRKLRKYFYISVKFSLLCQFGQQLTSNQTFTSFSTCSPFVAWLLRKFSPRLGIFMNTVMLINLRGGRSKISVRFQGPNIKGYNSSKNVQWAENWGAMGLPRVWALQPPSLKASSDLNTFSELLRATSLPCLPLSLPHY